MKTDKKKKKKKKITLRSNHCQVETEGKKI